MSDKWNKLAGIVLDRVYTYGYQQRAAEIEQCKAEDDLLAAERKLADAAAEIEALRQELAAGDKALRILAKDRDHWRESRQQAIEAGDLMRAEIETLRGDRVHWQAIAESYIAFPPQQCGDNAELERLRLEVVKLRTLNDGLRESNKRLRAQLAASGDNAELERLRAFVGKVLACVHNEPYTSQCSFVASIAQELAALDDIDLTPTNPAPASETTGGAE